MSGLDFQLPDTLVEEDLLGLLNGFPGYNPTEPVLSFPTTGLPQRQQSQSRSDEGSAEAQQDLEMDTDARLRSKIKNKTAQKRFRERQKSKAQENERRVAELSRELDAVRLENTRLSTRAATMEKVLQLRGNQPLPLQLDSAKPQRLLEYSGLTQAEELPKPKLNGPLAYTLPFSTVTLTVGPEIRSLRGEQIANMSWQEHRDVYKEYAIAFRAIPSIKELRSDPPRYARFSQLAKELEQFCGLLALHNIRAMLVFNRLNLEEPATPGPFDHWRWPEVVAALDLTPAQRSQMCAFWRSWLPEMGRLQEARRRSQALLAGASASMTANYYCFTNDHLMTMDGLDAVTRGLFEENQHKHAFYGNGLCKIMESIQFAKAVSITFPHALDGIALAEEVARQDGVEPATVLLLSGMANHRWQPSSLVDPYSSSSSKNAAPNFAGYPVEQLK